jgi:hypothetical protein
LQQRELFNLVSSIADTMICYPKHDE